MVDLQVCFNLFLLVPGYFNSSKVLRQLELFKFKLKYKLHEHESV